MFQGDKFSAIQPPHETRLLYTYAPEAAEYMRFVDVPLQCLRRQHGSVHGNAGAGSGEFRAIWSIR
jgi:hypothetical protein